MQTVKLVTRAILFIDAMILVTIRTKLNDETHSTLLQKQSPSFQACLQPRQTHTHAQSTTAEFRIPNFQSISGESHGSV